MFGSHDRSNPLWPSASRYVLAIVGTLIGFGATISLKRVLPTSDTLFFLPAVALSVWYGGRGPGIVATALSALLLGYAAEAEAAGPLRIAAFADPLEVGAFIVKALIITEVIEALRRARRLAESQAAELRG